MEKVLPCLARRERERGGGGGSTKQQQGRDLICGVGSSHLHKLGKSSKSLPKQHFQRRECSIHLFEHTSRNVTWEVGS